MKICLYNRETREIIGEDEADGTLLEQLRSGYATEAYSLGPAWAVHVGEAPFAFPTPEDETRVALAAEQSALLGRLASTDWYAIRAAETGEPIPDAIRAERQAARERVSVIRGELAATKEPSDA